MNEITTISWMMACIRTVSELLGEALPGERLWVDGTRGLDGYVTGFVQVGGMDMIMITGFGPDDSDDDRIVYTVLSDRRVKPKNFRSASDAIGDLVRLQATAGTAIAA